MPIDSKLVLITNTLNFDKEPFAQDSGVISELQPKAFINQLSTSKFENHSIKHKNTDWLSGIFIFTAILIAIANFIFRKRLLYLFKAFLARNYSNQLMREGNIFKDQISLLLFVVYILSIPGFYLLAVLKLFPLTNYTINTEGYISSLVVVISLWGFKVLFTKSMSVLFNTGKASHEILTQIFIFNLISGIILLPCLVIFHYSEITFFLYFNIGIWVIIQIHRFIRLAIVGFSYSIFSILHLFLYLCTLEIIPVILLIKLLQIRLGY
jgi:hypothetical protein